MTKTNDKELVLFRIRDGYTYHEIANKFNMNQSTVISHIKRYVCFMYRDFIYNKQNLNQISVLYSMSTDICIKCLKEAEKFLHIGLCHSLLITKG